MQVKPRWFSWALVYQHLIFPYSFFILVGFKHKKHFKQYVPLAVKLSVQRHSSMNVAYRKWLSSSQMWMKCLTYFKRFFFIEGSYSTILPYLSFHCLKWGVHIFIVSFLVCFVFLSTSITGLGHLIAAFWMPAVIIIAKSVCLRQWRWRGWMDISKINEQ